MFVIEQVMLYNAISCIIALKFQTECNKKKGKRQNSQNSRVISRCIYTFPSWHRITGYFLVTAAAISKKIRSTGFIPRKYFITV